MKSFQAPTAVSGADAWAYDVAGKIVVADKQGTSFGIVISGLSGYP